MARGLGKGLGALLPDEMMSEAVRGAVVDLRINEISPNSEQPRRLFDKEKLEELAESIRANGVIQPVIVRLAGTHVEEGRRILARSGLPIIRANTLAEAAERAVAAWKNNPSTMGLKVVNA